MNNHMRHAWMYTCVLVWLTCAEMAWAQEVPATTPETDIQAPQQAAPSRWSRPLWHLGRHTLDAHVGWTTTPLQLTAVGATALMVRTDLDARIQRQATRQNRTFSVAWSGPALISGLAAPVLLPAGLWLLSDDPEHIDGGAAAVQAVAVAFTINNLLKAITNRQAPQEGVRATNADARKFRFGFLRQGTIEGWPSGHAMTNIAMSTALATYYADNPWVQVGAYSWAAYVLASTTFGIDGGVHWASDSLAGALMGWSIGYTVGQGFASRRDGQPAQAAPQLLPMAVEGGYGLSVFAHF